ncbi:MULTISPECIES: erythromycin resistance leader peptide [Bifidobacterium]
MLISGIAFLRLRTNR